MSVGESWVYQRRKDIKRWTGCSPVNPLGSGSYGTVFKTNNPRLVLKITSHEAEAKTLALIMKLRMDGVELSSIINIRRLIHFKVPSRVAYSWSASDRLENLFFVVRELLEPIKKEFSTWSLNSYLSHLTAGDKERYRERMERVLAKDYPDMYKTLGELAKRDIYLWDIRPSNIGLRNDQIVIHDVVAAEPLPEVTIPSLGILK